MKCYKQSVISGQSVYINIAFFKSRATYDASALYVNVCIPQPGTHAWPTGVHLTEANYQCC